MALIAGPLVCIGCGAAMVMHGRRVLRDEAELDGIARNKERWGMSRRYSRRSAETGAGAFAIIGAATVALGVVALAINLARAFM